MLGSPTPISWYFHLTIKLSCIAGAGHSLRRELQALFDTVRSRELREIGSVFDGVIVG